MGTITAPFIAAATVVPAPVVAAVRIAPPYLEPTTQVFQARVDKALVNTVPPSISGLVMEGQQLEVDPGLWEGTTGTITFGYQWQRCDSGGGSCVDIPGETARTYIVQAADIGGTLRVNVTASYV